MRQLFIIQLLVLASLSINAQDLSGRDIMQKVKDRPDGDTRYSELVMKLINKRGRTRERKMKSYSMDIGKDKRTIMFFEYPGDVKGTGFLTWDYDKVDKDDDKWLYLPAMKKTRRISGSSAKKDYFMGSDFTYDDMGSRSVDEDTHKLLKEEILDGKKCWVIESKPKNSDEIYSKKISWIRQDCLMFVRVKYYDKMNKLHRELNISDIKKVDGFWTKGSLVMKNVQKKHSTKMFIKNPKFNVDIDKSLFSISNLEMGEF